MVIVWLNQHAVKSKIVDIYIWHLGKIKRQLEYVTCNMAKLAQLQQHSFPEILQRWVKLWWLSKPSCNDFKMETMDNLIIFVTGKFCLSYAFSFSWKLRNLGVRRIQQTVLFFHEKQIASLDYR